jgi:hypothetical protein
MNTAVVRLAISRHVLLTSNQRIHYMEKARHTKQIRELAYMWCRAHRPQKMHAATCDIEVTWPDNRQRDVLNLEPTYKACFDGIIGDTKPLSVSYNLLPSDSDLHLRKVSVAAGSARHKVPGIACFLTFRFTEVHS